MRLSLDDAIEYISDDELVEVTPLAIRLRKKELDPEKRVKAAKQAAGVGAPFWAGERRRGR